MKGTYTLEQMNEIMELISEKYGNVEFIAHEVEEYREAYNKIAKEMADSLL